MRLIDRYLFRQMLGPTLLATASLTAVAVLSQFLSGLDILVDQRQSPWVLAKITLLAMPQLIAMILPIAVLVAALVALNRLHTEQEIVTCFSAGMSRWKVVAPAVELAAWLALISLVLTLWVQPLCYRALRETLESVRSDLFGVMIKPGRFTHPAPGLTVYAQSVDDDGTIHNLFIDRVDSSGRETTITAREGRLERRRGVPVLVMHNGSNQEFNAAGVLNYLSFDVYVFDLRPLISADRGFRYKLSDLYLHELVFPDARRAWGQGAEAKLLAEAHSRLAGPLYNIAFMLMALAAILGGAFNKLGYGARIGLVAAAAVLARTLGFAAQALAGSGQVLNVLQYLIPLAAALGATFVLFAARKSARAPRFSRPGPLPVSPGRPA